MIHLVTGIATKPRLSGNTLRNINTCENWFSNLSHNLNVVAIKLIELTMYAWQYISISFYFERCWGRVSVHSTFMEKSMIKYLKKSWVLSIFICKYINIISQTSLPTAVMAKWLAGLTAVLTARVRAPHEYRFSVQCKVIAVPAFYDAIAVPTEFIISIVNSVKNVNIPLAWLPLLKEGKSICILLLLKIF